MRKHGLCLSYRDQALFVVLRKNFSLGGNSPKGNFKHFFALYRTYSYLRVCLLTGNEQGSKDSLLPCKQSFRRAALYGKERLPCQASVGLVIDLVKYCPGHLSGPHGTEFIYGRAHMFPKAGIIIWPGPKGGRREEGGGQEGGEGGGGGEEEEEDGSFGWIFASRIQTAPLRNGTAAASTYGKAGNSFTSVITPYSDIADRIL